MKIHLVSILSLHLLLACSPKEKKPFLATQDVTLATPILECTNPFFTDSLEVTMKFALPDVQIKYSVDDSEVTEKSDTFMKPLLLKQSTTIRAKAYHPDYASSATSSLHVFRTNAKLQGSTIGMSPEPHERYHGQGALTLMDHQKGTTAFANGNAWLGFQSDTITFDIDFRKRTSLSKITLSTLINHGAWIFRPKGITVFSGKEKIGAKQLTIPKEPHQARFEFIEIPLAQRTVDGLSIVVASLDSIPTWHQGKGTPSWFFIDEILVE